MTGPIGGNGWQDAEVVGVNMARARFRDVDLSGARLQSVILAGAEIGGDIRGLVVNDVEVAPLIEAELDRRHPERRKLRATTPAGVREAWQVVEEFWAGTMAAAADLSDADRHRSVNGEWSFVQTLRHLIFITDAWLSHALLGLANPFHPYGLPPSFVTGADAYGVDLAAAPSYEEVVAVRAGRMAQVRAFLQQVTQPELDQTREPNLAPGWPPAAPRLTTTCLHVLFNEEWAHHRFAVRDLAVLRR
ncbi:MAG TPA: DinB family protein [Natronosporangium sp.]